MYLTADFYLTTPPNFRHKTDIIQLTKSFTNGDVLQQRN